MIDTDEVNRLINGINSKDLDDIIARKTYIPTLGSDYTKEELVSWLNKRIVFLKDLLTNNIPLKERSEYLSLDESTKLLADRMLDGEEIVCEDPEQYESLYFVRLQMAATDKQYGNTV